MQVHMWWGHQLFIKTPKELKHCADSLHRSTLHCLLGLCWRWEAKLGPLNGPWCWNVLQSSFQGMGCHNEGVRSAPWPFGLLLLTCAGTKACRDRRRLHGNSPDGLLLVQVLSEDLQIVESWPMMTKSLEDERKNWRQTEICISVIRTHHTTLTCEQRQR